MSNNKTISTIIVDDHPIVRAGMRAVLQATDDILVVAEGGSGSEALELVNKHTPQVLVLDVNLPDFDGLEVARQLRAQKAKTAILILTAYNDKQLIFNLLECGAVGYVLKDEALETLANAVRAAASGENWLSPAVARQVVRRAIGQETPLPMKQPDVSLADLTRREVEVLRLLAQGLDNTTIAEELVLTPRTVQNHVSNIYSKLAVASRAEAILYAIRNGLVKIENGENKIGA